MGRSAASAPTRNYRIRKATTLHYGYHSRQYPRRNMHLQLLASPAKRLTSLGYYKRFIIQTLPREFWVQSVIGIYKELRSAAPHSGPARGERTAHLAS